MEVGTLVKVEDEKVGVIVKLGVVDNNIFYRVATTDGKRLWYGKASLEVMRDEV